MFQHPTNWPVRLFLCALIAAETHAEEGKVEFGGCSRAAELAIEKLAMTIDRLKTYADDATVGINTVWGFRPGDMPVAFVYERPKRFRLRTQTHDLYSNGRQLTVYAKQMRRYTEEPLEEDIEKQIRPHGGGTRVDFSMAGLLLAHNPRKYLAQRFTGLDLTGDETIEDDPCVILKGTIANAQRLNGSRGDADVTLWLRKADSMIRRIEIDMSPKEEEKEGEDEEGPFRMLTRGLKVVYDVRDLKVDKPVDKSEFDFESPTGARKVDRFYSSGALTGDTAMQFELSGRPAPDFELETTDGDWKSLRSLQGNVVILSFLSPRIGFMRPQGLKELEEVRRAYADRNVAVICVLPEDDAEQFLKNMAKDDVRLTVLLDPGSTATSEYFAEPFAQGVVLVDGSGVVQGRYPSSLNTEAVESLRKDIDKLLKGETLPGGKPMSEKELEEARDQQSAAYTTDAANPVNEDDLRETWAVPATDNRGFGFRFGSSAPTSRGLWIRHKDVVREVDPHGEVIAEIPLPNPSYDRFSQDQFVVGRFGGRLSVAYMATIPGDTLGGFGWRAPKGATITVADATGRELWNMELEAKAGQTPQHLTAADLDGRAGDELLFHHQGSLWIVDGRARVLVRKLLSGQPEWIRVDDLDHDKRPEIYVRTQDRLYRYDYRPQGH